MHILLLLIYAYAVAITNIYTPHFPAVNSLYFHRSTSARHNVLMVGIGIGVGAMVGVGARVMVRVGVGVIDEPCSLLKDQSLGNHDLGCVTFLPHAISLSNIIP